MDWSFFIVPDIWYCDFVCSCCKCNIYFILCFSKDIKTAGITAFFLYNGSSCNRDIGGRESNKQLHKGFLRVLHQWGIHGDMYESWSCIREWSCKCGLQCHVRFRENYIHQCAECNYSDYYCRACKKCGQHYRKIFLGRNRLWQQ